MSVVQFTQASITAVAHISNDGRHITRDLSFDDGHQVTLGMVLGGDEQEVLLDANNQSAARIEITQGDCQVHLEGQDSDFEYYREGQSFLLPKDTAITIKCEETVQYIRHLEG